MERLITCRRALPWVTIGLVAAAGPAAGQAVPTAVILPIEEIIVTARKREERLLEVPVAVSAFSAEAIEQQGIEDLADIARFTPGFSMNPALGRQPTSYRPVIRGVTTVRNGIANANAGNTFVDGVYVSGALLNTELENLERVEILRGPQSAQFGRNTYVGAVNYVTRQPAETFTGGLTGTVAQDDTADLAGWASGPLVSDKLLSYVGAGHREYGGEWTNTRDGSDVGGEESDEFMAKLLFRPLENLDATLRLGWQATDDQHFAMYLQPEALNNCCFRTPEAPRAREYYTGKAVPGDNVTLYTDLLEANGGAGTEVDRSLGSLVVNWRVAGVTLTSVTGVIHDDIDTGTDLTYAAYDASPPAPPGSPPESTAGLFLIREGREYEDFSQELRLTSPADRSLRYAAGLYYADSRVDSIYRNRISPADGIARPDLRSDEEVENRAIFAAVEWDLAERWTAGMELRWAEDDVTVTNRGALGFVTPPSPFERDDESLTPRFTLSWRATDMLTWYANVAKGVKPLDINSRVPLLPSGETDESYRFVDEETAWNYELGLKALFWDRRLSVVAAGYYLQVEDQQLTELVDVPGVGPISLMTNAQQTDVVGLESEISIEIAPNLSLDATYGWTKSEFDKWISQDEADLRGSDGSFADNQRLGDVSGHSSPRVPEHAASLRIRYQRPLTDVIDWYGGADYSYESSKYAAEHNLIETGDRNLVGLRTGLQVGRWDTSLWVRNLFDDDTPVDVLRYFDGRSGPLPTYGYLGPRPSSSPRGFAIPLPRGRQAGLTVRYRF
jgi:outer membrane receptor protein involved in Fe transport